MGRLRLRLTRVVAATMLVAAVVAGCGGGGASSPGTTGTPKERAQFAARAFLGRYVDPDGRVVRRDQGADTVSEGQSYALLTAVALGDRARFDRVWSWTRTHLQRGDGLLSSRWAGGNVTDPQPAADADLDAAHALRLAATRFGVPAYARESRRMADAMRGAEIRDGVVLAGPWAVQRGLTNPSYFDPRALAALHMDDVAGATRRVVAALAGSGAPPPDWAQVTPGGGAVAAGPPGGGGPSYGYDAARVPIRLAASCDAQDRRLAAGLRGLKEAAPGPHPVFVVAQAAQAAAAGDAGHAGALLDAAVRQDDRGPTYYGAAWVALGRLLLQTDLLGACPMGP